ncbi:hypothetical protein CYLTODRAFT_422066 [Cylindrobasidium torrendii FP15055 ss-10]|uniref:Integral membrane protein n=1 Tax=Cylindrobasidium torrendii FP15055 ss-10 TaxID=1314674 RepID=A0A0D7BBN9_9AGAR|nr:hypothetical protein CYLTODRAFT_422066 [Cylindrobasidium torrendii FP15055 ss-10]
MPSVRIKRSQYSTLRDGAERPVSAGSQLGRRLSDVFRRSGSPDPQITDQHEPSPSTTSPRVESPMLRKLDPPPSPTTRRGRPRAGSRVQDHCMSQASSVLPTASPGLLRNERSTTSFINDRRTASPPRTDTVYTLQGPTTDIQYRQDGPPGSPRLVDRALSVSSADEASFQSYAPLDDHHHDQIVEHLDAIDPQVATVSNMTNAANAIIFPPMSWYKRKPVLVLPDPPKGQDEERDGKLDDALDRHVNDVLQRPSKVRRSLMGLWSFLKTPMGVLTAIYGFCVVFWGAAIVLFLGKLINLHNDNLQGFWVEVSSQVVNGLFTVTGIGLIPSRVLDTYRVYWIWHYKRKTRQLRKKARLPPLFDEDDLPDPMYDPNYVHVLTNDEQYDLHRQQVKFQHHQTWYRPHGTATHRAFPINTALLICLLNDGNSFFQILLCACMWSMNRFQRPPWTTGTLIPASFLCGIGSAVYIARGSAKTRRTKDVAKRLREALTKSEEPYANTSTAALARVDEQEKTTGSRLANHMTFSAMDTAAEKQQAGP